MGAWPRLLSQPSVQDAAVIAGIANEAASQKNKGFAVIRSAERHMREVPFRVSMLPDMMGGGELWQDSQL